MTVHLSCNGHFSAKMSKWVVEWEGMEISGTRKTRVPMQKPLFSL